nr:class II heat shock protein [Tanacetum cinerariifolium]
EDYQREFKKLINRVTDIPDSLLISFYISGLKLNPQPKFLVSRPTTLGDAFSLARIIEARFESIAKKEKEQIVKKKTYAILPLESELASPKINGSLNVDEDIGVDEVSSAIDGVFDIGNVESMEVRSKFGEFSNKKKTVEEVVSGGEVLEVG